jgi:hypothetical protein
MICNEERMSDSSKPTRFSRVLEFLLALAELAVIAINVVLFRQNLSLRQTLAPQNHSGNTLREPFWGRARRSPPATCSAVRGFQARHHNFSPSCPACQANQEGGMQLASTLEQQRIRTSYLGLYSFCFLFRYTFGSKPDAQLLL